PSGQSDAIAPLLHASALRSPYGCEARTRYRRSPSAGSKITSAPGESKPSDRSVQGSVAGLVCHPAGTLIWIPWTVELDVGVAGVLAVGEGDAGSGMP